MLGNLHHNLCEYKSLRGESIMKVVSNGPKMKASNSQHGTRIPSNGIQNILFYSWNNLFDTAARRNEWPALTMLIISKLAGIPVLRTAELKN
ncbi:hypothetical protein TNCV_1402581 [Trichonephila clavipes]|nr:hypothetical protein TNCV_1402581 [Trichonephila clavipes]